MYTKVFINWQESRPFSPDSLEIQKEKGWRYPLSKSVSMCLVPVARRIACHRGSLSASQAACPSVLPENLTRLPSQILVPAGVGYITQHHPQNPYSVGARALPETRLCWQVHSLELSQHLPETHLAALQVENTPWGLPSGVAGFSVFWL